ncbi:MAG: hypothetical protein FWD68_02395 [Alphaproteobacteria bacterium]|nr:hypothetical protein [Alphaproteobacteria bacterium]
MNHSICFADSTTHLKILGLAVMASIVLAFTAHAAGDHRATFETGIATTAIQSVVSDTNLTAARDVGSARQSG